MLFLIVELYHPVAEKYNKKRIQPNTKLEKDGYALAHCEIYHRIQYTRLNGQEHDYGKEHILWISYETYWYGI